MTTRLFIKAILLLTLISCNSKPRANGQTSENDDYPDNKYCADVTYFNPSTGTQSSYRLTVDVENNKVVELDFPNGGKLDQNHFSPAELNEEGDASFTSDKGYDYKIEIVGQTTNCFDGVPMVKQCRGITKSGRQCRHLTDNANGLCWQHQNQK
jgi:hypothetical protein